MAEICLVTMLALVEYKVPPSNETFCWSWKFGSSSADDDLECPFVLLFIATLVLGILLLSTFSFVLLKRCTEVGVDGIPCCRFLRKYGAFVLNLLAFLLVLVFIVLIVVFSNDSKEEEIHLTGAFLSPNVVLHYRFALVCVGTFMTLLATVLSGVIAFRPRLRATADEFLDSGMVRSFSDYSRPEYEKIN